MVELSKADAQGPLWAIAIVFAWCLTIVYCLACPLASWSWVGIVIGVSLRTFLHTGLFILAHDAMHGTLLAHLPDWNHRVGRCLLYLYACLSYRQCIRNHGQHHLFPGQREDPDFHNGVSTHPLLWYGHFMGGYLSWSQLKGFVLIFGAIALPLRQLGYIAYANFCIFYLLPILLSSLQLFFFGTYLPHREQHQDKKIQSPPPRWIIAWSFLSCYHFGEFHEEHHRNPIKPWYKLPKCNTFNKTVIKFPNTYE